MKYIQLIALRIIGILVLGLSLSDLAIAQQKKILVGKDSSEWSALYSSTLSADGKWIAYRPTYENGSDTLYIRSIAGTIIHPFPSGGAPVFSVNGTYVATLVPGKGLALLHLKSGKISYEEQTESFEFLQGGRYIAILTQQDDEKVLYIRDLKSGTLVLAQAVENYTVNPQADALIYTSKAAGNSIHLVNLSPSIHSTLIHSTPSGSYQQVSWNRQGDAVAFIQDNRLMRYVISGSDGEKGKFDVFEDEAAFTGKHIPSYMKLIISDDHRFVFFHLLTDSLMPVDSLVEVWHARDTWIYPHRQGRNDWSHIPKLWVWLADDHKIRQISDNQQPFSVITGDHRHVLTYNSMWHEPQFKQMDDVDVYLTDVVSGKKRKIIEQLENGLDVLVWVSPGGRYIAYFKAKNWWSYDLETNTHSNLTAELDVPLETILGSSLTDGSVYAHGIAGWIKNDQGFIVYDEYDCWLLSPAGQAPKLLTHGRDQQMRFRLCQDLTGNFKGRDFGGEALDLSTGLVLEAKAQNKALGYYMFTKSGTVPLFFQGNKRSYALRTAPTSNSYLYLEENFEQPTRLMYWNKGMRNPEIVYQSNPQYTQYDWGRAELISYKNSKGEELKGALFYPAGYSLGKKYPMIVQIYQHLSGSIYEYENPTDEMSARLSVRAFTSDGYIVLCPDINYTVGDPGMSALDCVEKAVNAVLRKDIVEEQHIGLIGHSYGGYETSFIMTQSQLFATAIAGAPVTDLVKGYFTIREDYMHTADSWRYETQQHRFGFSFYDNKEAFLRNSPVHQASKIDKPILIWTGQEDRNVHWHQSLELYFALRRLGKPGALLVYPEEHHVITDQERQKDLFQRTKQWFGHYLKGASAADWIKIPVY